MKSCSSCFQRPSKNPAALVSSGNRSLKFSMLLTRGVQRTGAELPPCPLSKQSPQSKNHWHVCSDETSPRWLCLAAPVTRQSSLSDGFLTKTLALTGEPRQMQGTVSGAGESTVGAQRVMGLAGSGAGLRQDLPPGCWEPSLSTGINTS